MNRILLALALGAGDPALPTTGLGAEVQAVAPSIARIDGELAAYGAWLTRLQAVMNPLDQELRGLSEAWQQSLQAGSYAQASERMRPVIQRILAAVDRAESGLASLDTPEMPLLELSEDLRPAAILVQSRELTRRIRPAVQSFMPLLEAIGRNDEAAGTAAVGRTMDSLALVLDSQILMLRAGMAATDRDDPSWHEMNVRLLFTRAGARAIAVFPRDLATRPRPEFTAELRTIADQLDVTAREGSPLLERYIALAEEQADDPETASLARRARAALIATRPVFPLASEMAQLLRSTAAEGDQVSVQRVGRMMARFRDLKLRLDATAMESQAALARQY